MYKVKGAGIVWDSVNNAPLATFAGGVFETENKKVADRLKELGFEVTGDTPAKAKQVPKEGG